MTPPNGLSFQAMELLTKLNSRSVAVSYLQLLVEIVTERGFSSSELLTGLPIPAKLLDQPGARLSPVQWGLVVNRAMLMCDDAGLGYECGLRMRPTVSGYLGYAVMSSPSVGEAMNLLARYIESRQRAFSIRVDSDSTSAVVELRQNHALPVLRSFFYEHILVGIARGLISTLGLDFDAEPVREMELWFDWPEPDYHSRYQERLPRARFSRSSNCLRVPASLLDAVPLLADPHASRQAVEHCERELAQLGGEDDSISWRVSAELVLTPHEGYPDQQAVAKRLHQSTRTLARQLAHDGTSFRRLLDEARYRDARQLLESSPMAIADIAAYLGYSNPANFTRAFRQWSGQAPSAYRQGNRAETVRSNSKETSN